MNKAYLLLGSNEGDRQNWIGQSINLLASKCGIIEKRSFVYETAAWGNTDQASFLNIAVLLLTMLSPHDLLSSILEIEIDLGRVRNEKWGPRIIDIDILLFNDEIIHTKELIVPHPLMQDRKFTLMPLNDIAGDVEHPVFHKTIALLLAECTDILDVVKL